MTNDVDQCQCTSRLHPFRRNTEMISKILIQNAISRVVGRKDNDIAATAKQKTFHVEYYTLMPEVFEYPLTRKKKYEHKI